MGTKKSYRSGRCFFLFNIRLAIESFCFALLSTSRSRHPDKIEKDRSNLDKTLHANLNRSNQEVVFGAPSMPDMNRPYLQLIHLLDNLLKRQLFTVANAADVTPISVMVLYISPDNDIH